MTTIIIENKGLFEYDETAPMKLPESMRAAYVMLFVQLLFDSFPPAYKQVLSVTNTFYDSETHRNMVAVDISYDEAIQSRILAQIDTYLQKFKGTPVVGKIYNYLVDDMNLSNKVAFINIIHKFAKEFKQRLMAVSPSLSNDMRKHNLAFMVLIEPQCIHCQIIGATLAIPPLSVKVVNGDVHTYVIDLMRKLSPELKTLLKKDKEHKL